jgi:hypothetical protein
LCPKNAFAVFEIASEIGVNSNPIASFIFLLEYFSILLDSNTSKIEKYSNKKIKEAIGFEFTPISEAISKTAKAFLGHNS